VDVAEKQAWVALFSAEGLDRTVAKRALYRHTLAEGALLSACEPEALGTLMPELDAAQRKCWAAALGQQASMHQRTAAWAREGIEVLLRSDPLYPENLVRRESEAWLPYLLFYRGNLELLEQPGVYVTGSGSPTAPALDFLSDLAGQVATLELVSLGMYAQGVDREFSRAATQRQGPTALMLPLGLGHAGAIHREGLPALQQSQRLELSPVMPEVAHSPALLRACRRLLTGLAEVLVVVEDERPEDWPGLPEMVRDGGLVLVYAGQSASAAAWAAQGATLVSDASTAAQRMAEHASLHEDADTETPPEAESDREDATPIQFESADSAIARLSQTGRVPPALARRLREAENSGTLGQKD
jgi:predicted Rossmann fold nucleotide-binding protein DprA/Smf involved in DNA uptake